MHKIWLLWAGLALLAACTPTMANRGNMVDPDKLSQIKKGSSTREEVVNKLGTPTEIATFDENIWYYFGRRTEQYAFFDPEVLEQQAVEIHFDENGIVTEVDKLDPSASQEINPVTRRTPTYGHETTFFEQLLGNMGRPGAPGGKPNKR